MDFVSLPPEINSGLMYTGPGPGPLLGAAAAWDSLAAELHSTAASYSSVISGLTAAWRGPSSVAMATAAAPFMVWMSTTAAQAEQTASQARAAVAAYEAAFAATVPPASIAANRAQLIALIATNFFGQNTPAIMATEAQYTEMWGQDAAAMYGYAGSSASASQFTPFSRPPHTTNSGAMGGSGAAAAETAATNAQALPQAMVAAPQSLQSLAAPAAAAAPFAAPAADPTGLLSALDSFTTGPLSPASLFTIPGVNYLLGTQLYLTPQAGANLTSSAENYGKAVAKESTSGLAGSGMAPRTVSAGTGRAGLVGRLSVPQGWASAAPEIKTIASILPRGPMSAAPAMLAAESPSSLYGPMALSGLAGRTVVGNGGAGTRYAGTRSTAAVDEVATTSNIFVIPETDDFEIPEAGE
ncbi:PPE family protein [Mycobacterium sp. Lab-001]|uniref:PPE family protein n=1 Tax=Mycobacterium sp. Lab-001 TaxID=3410136 RepID=UPI003D1725E8